MSGSQEFSSFITSIAESNSFTSIEYGKGRKIDYNLEKISRKLRPLLVDNKVLIDITSEVKFSYLSSDEDANPFF